jgi:O-antigen ligase
VAAVALCGMIRGMAISPVGPTVFVLAGLLLPLFYGYVGGVVRRDPLASDRIQLALTLAIFMLLVGNIVSVFLGLKVEVAVGAGTIRGTRNLGDFNVASAYLLLLWPFAVGFLRRHDRIWFTLLCALYIVAVGLSFTRTALVMTPVVLALGLSALRLSPNRRELAVVLFLCLIVLIGGLSTVQDSDVLRFWMQRLDLEPDERASPGRIIEALASAVSSSSTRGHLRAEAVDLFRQSPLIGHGWGSFRELSPSGFSSAHSLTHDLLAESGLIGAGLFWLLVVTAAAGHLAWCRARSCDRRMGLLFGGMAVLWLVTAHTMGAQLVLASRTGFQINLINGLLLVILLRPDVVRSLIRRERGLAA